MSRGSGDFRARENLSLKMEPAMALVLDLDGLADLFGDAQSEWSALAVVLALLLGLAVLAHLRRAPVPRIGGSS
jgi:hypothetical protein